MKNKTVQIPEQLFFDLCEYHLRGHSEPLEDIEHGLLQKLDKMIAHINYTQSLTAATPEQRERARQKYLDAKGIPPSFRWDEGGSPYKEPQK